MSAMKRVWPRNAWGAPRGIPFITPWLTKRWHRRFGQAMAEGWREGFERARAGLDKAAQDEAG